VQGPFYYYQGTFLPRNLASNASANSTACPERRFPALRQPGRSSFPVCAAPPEYASEPRGQPSKPPADARFVQPQRARNLGQRPPIQIIRRQGKPVLRRKLRQRLIGGRFQAPF